MDKETLKAILSSGYHPESWNLVLTDIFGVTNLLRQPRTVALPANELAEAAFELGSFETADARIVGLYRVDLTDKPRIWQNRVGLRSLLRNVYKYDVDAALVVFVQNDKWRLSLISEIRGLDESGHLVELKTEPKRFTFLLGANETVQTARDRLQLLGEQSFTLEKLIDAFSVEKLTKEFFKRYKQLFGEFCEHLTNSPQYRELFLNSRTKLKDGWKDKEAKPIRDFVKILLGRLVFLQFLQKKAWMGVPAGENAWENGDARFLQNLFRKTNDQDHFHSGSLRTLFFETLNRKRKDDLVDRSLGEDVRIPYLNGGLFDADISSKHDIDFPKELFGDLLEFFEQYNFTIDEDDPYDREVGIDPEMLGHIFENLLEENREKGAFYTPKEIVHYMCHESLIEYIATHLPEGDRSAIEKLVRENQVAEGFTAIAKATEINRLLRDVKICDPAIGSGAFPMGLLKEIFECRRLVYPYLKTNETFDPARIKKEIIQNNIYGVDIDNGAVEIARLRFWLALVVDEIEPAPLPNLDYKIMQGNSLLEQFEDISLVFDKAQLSPDIYVERNLFGDAVNPQISLMDVLRVQQELGEFDVTKLESEFFGTEDAQQKAHIREQLNRLERLVIEQAIKAKETAIRSEISKIKAEIAHKHAAVRAEQRDKVIPSGTFKKLNKLEAQLEGIAKSKELLQAIRPDNKPYFLWRLYFHDVFERGGFDIVIGNPPYIALQKDGGFLADLYKDAGFETFVRTADIYCLFYEQGMRLLRSNGVLSYITSNSWLRTLYGQALREYLTRDCDPTSIVNIEDSQVFESAVVETNILLVRRCPWSRNLRAVSIQNALVPGFDIANLLRIQGNSIDELPSDGWVFGNEQETKLKAKIETSAVSLKDSRYEIYRGLTTGLNEAFFVSGELRKQMVSEDPNCKSIIKPAIRGKDISKYTISWKQQWAIVVRSGSTNRLNKGGSPEYSFKSNYPAIYNHFRTVGDAYVPGGKKKRKGLYERDDQGDYWWELRSCAYYDDFEEEKIVWGELSDEPKFALDSSGSFANNTIFFMSGPNLKYLLAVLNSQLSRWYFNVISTSSGMGTNRWLKYKVEQFPVKDISLEDQKPLVKLVDQILEKKSDEAHSDTTALEHEIDKLVYKLYDLTEDEIAIIEGGK